MRLYRYGILILYLILLIISRQIDVFSNNGSVEKILCIPRVGRSGFLEQSINSGRREKLYGLDNCLWQKFAWQSSKDGKGFQKLVWNDRYLDYLILNKNKYPKSWYYFMRLTKLLYVVTDYTFWYIHKREDIIILRCYYNEKLNPNLLYHFFGATKSCSIQCLAKKMRIDPMYCTA